MPSARVLTLTLGLVLTALATAPAPAFSQGIGGLRKKAEEAKKKVDDASKKPAADPAAAKPTGDAAKPPSAPPASSPAPAPASGSAQGPSGAAAKADAKVWENYDFVPGSKIIFFTDFADDKVGNFARGLKYVSGPAEVVERDGAKVLRSTARSTMLIPTG